MQEDSKLSSYPTDFQTGVRPAISLIVLSAVLYGLLGFFGVKILKEQLAIYTMLFWRFFIAFIWMLAWEITSNSLKSIKYSFTNPSLPLLVSGICYGLSSFFYFLACKHTGTGLAMVVFFAYPVFVAISVWSKNLSQCNLFSLLALMLVLAGLYLLQINNSSPIEPIGIILALLASLSYAFYILRSGHIMKKFRSGQFTILICFICSCFFLLLAVSFHQFALPPNLNAWGYVLAIGILATALPIQLLLTGLKSVSLIKASILSAFEPIVTLLVGILALNEEVSTIQLVGIAIILLGTLVIQFSKD